MMDPPEHERLRELVSRVFTPRAGSRFEPIVREVIAYTSSRSTGRAVRCRSRLAGPFPVEVIARSSASPRATGSRSGTGPTPAAPGARPAGADRRGPGGVVAGRRYFHGLVGEKRRHPGRRHDQPAHEAEVDREDGQGATKLDDAEIAGFATLLGGAGAETVPSSSATVRPVRPPSRAVPEGHRRPEQDPTAVEEILRTGRRPSTRAGSHCRTPSSRASPCRPAIRCCCTGAANRDERAFDDPDAFDIDRPPSQSLGFGLGIHSCLGAALARMESRIAIEEMARRWPSYEIDEGGLGRVHMSNVAGFSNVPVQVSASTTPQR